MSNKEQNLIASTESPKPIPEGGRVFGLDEQTMFQAAIQLFSLILLAFILKKLLYKPVRKFMEKRKTNIEESLNKAKHEMQNAVELKKEYEKKLEEVENERLDILSQAREDGKEEWNVIIQNALDEAYTIRKNANEQMVEEQERFNKEANSIIISLSADMANKVLSSFINDDDHRKINQKIVEQMEEKI